MPIVHLTTWSPQSDDTARELMEALTDTVARVTGAPLDKITVLISEIPRNRWAEGGAIGDDPDFAVRSRQTGYLPARSEA